MRAEEGLAAVEVVLADPRDLTRRLEGAHPLAATVNGFLNRLAEAVEAVVRQTLAVSHDALALKMRLGPLREAAETTRAAAASIAGATGQLGADIARLVEVTEALKAFFEELDAEVEAERRAAGQFFQALAEVSQKVRTVWEVVGSFASEAEALLGLASVIDPILRQLRILGINAAIEAAHLGSRGRGFGVVAEAIDRLARESSEAVHQVQAVVERLQQDTRRMVEEARATWAAMDAMRHREAEEAARLERIWGRVQELGPALAALKETVDRQVAATAAIHTAAAEADRRAEGGLGWVTATAGTAAALHRAVEGLVTAVGGFRTQWQEPLVQQLEALAAHPALKQGGAAATRYLQAVVGTQPVFELLYLMDRRGVQVTPNVVHPSRQEVIAVEGLGVDRGQRPYFREAWDHAAPYVSPLYLSSATREWCLTVSVPVRDAEGRLTGILAADANVATLLSLPGPGGPHGGD
ncbi:MAG: hypothetical protein K6U14_00945 [Firmicutes bacterium]|nr:hypothetical protein [Alicyclobacillaceae bacterium]MCL6496185.1 hypothetical protein [Bacillota bacterium]